MVNLFDSANYPGTEPEDMVAGDLWAWKRPDIAATYPPAEYSLSYVANAESSSAASFTLQATGDDYAIIEADTKSHVPGGYAWEAFITRTSDSARVKVASGYWRINHNLAAGPTDARTHAKIVLDAVEAVIEGAATKQQSSMSIAGRSLEMKTYDELRQIRSDYAAEVAREKKDELKKQGKASNKILLRFPA